MRKQEIEIIKSMCECDMNISEVARKSHYHRNNIVYWIEQIEKKYKLDPRCFYDLVKLQEIINK